MGTNYYFFKERKKKKEEPEAGLHIGKNSYGWVFNFQAHLKERLMSYEEWKEYTKDGFIYDEYGSSIPYEIFWKYVEISKEPDIDREEPWSYYNYPEGNDLEVSACYMNNGFMFTNCDFS